MCSRFSVKNFSLSNITKKQKFVHTDQNFQRVLNTWDIISYGVAGTIGAGIFVTSGIGARNQAGPAIVFSFLISAFAALVSGLCYSELGVRVPVSGSAYSFTYVIFGEFFAWIIGWNFTLEYTISAAAVARGWAGYLVNLFHQFNVTLPHWVADQQVWNFDINLLPIFIIAICGLIAMVGIKESSWFNITMTGLNIGCILFIIILGSFNIKSVNWSNFFPVISPYKTSFQGIIGAAGTVFFSYIGFDSVTTLALEMKNPKKDLPFGIITTLIITTTLYIGVSIVITGMQPFTEINTESPLSSAFEAIGIKWAAILISFLSLTTLTGNVLVSIIGQPRIFYQMSVDGLLFKAFECVNKKGVPVFSTIFACFLALILATLLSLEALTNMISAGTLISYMVVCMGVMNVRYSVPAGENPPSYCRFDSEFLENISYFVSFNKTLMQWIYILFCAGLSLSIKFSFSLTSIIFYSIGILVLYLLFQILKPMNTEAAYITPLVPLLPMVGIFINIFLIIGLPIDALIRLLVWTGVGVLFYFAYGVHSSKMNNEALQTYSAN